jgi:predicted nuclease of predicted toxin-antitoxin system
LRWLADECVDAPLVAQMRLAGHDVTYTAETSPGISDGETIRIANDEARLLLTEDKDFGELIFRRGGDVPGFVLLRIDPERRTLKWTRLQAAIARFGERLAGHYTVVDVARMRSRPMPRAADN